MRVPTAATSQANLHAANNVGVNAASTCSNYNERGTEVLRVVGAPVSQVDLSAAIDQSFVHSNSIHPGSTLRFETPALSGFVLPGISARKSQINAQYSPTH